MYERALNADEVAGHVCVRYVIVPGIPFDMFSKEIVSAYTHLCVEVNQSVIFLFYYLVRIPRMITYSSYSFDFKK